MVIENLLLFLASCIVLVVAGVVLVKTLVMLSLFLRLKAFITAFILVALSTTLPELFVGINAALRNTPELSLGNVIGSNIADIALVGGIVLLLARKFRIETTVRKESWFVIGMGLVPVILMIIGRQLSRIDGVLLLLLFLAYSFYLVRTGKIRADEVKDHIPHWKGIAVSLLFVFSAVLLYYSAESVVKYGSLIAADLSISPILVGLVFVALGTSLPELVFGSQAAIQKHPDFAVGDLLGAVVTNSTLVLGVTALICPITGSFALFLTSAAFMLVALFLFATFASSGRKLNWIEGIALILFYILFLMVELNVKQYLVG